MGARLGVLLLHQRRRRRSRSPSTCRRTTTPSAGRWPATGASSGATRDGAVTTRLNAPTLRAAHREPRRAVRRPGRRRLCRRRRRERADPPPASHQGLERPPVKIAVICYASIGGSGIVATELAKCLAAPRPRDPRGQPRAAVPPRRRPAGRRVPPRRHAVLPAVPRAAVRAVALDDDRRRWRARSTSTSSTRTTRSRTPRPPTWPGRCWSARATPGCRAS